MSDDLVPAGFVYTKGLIEHAIQVEKENARRARVATRSALGWKLYSGASSTIIVLLVVALVFTVPLIRLVPILLYTTPDGMSGAALTAETMPDNMPKAAVVAWLWQYVMRRESYAWTEMDDNHRVVMAMSSDDVRPAYERWSSGKNPQSYQAVYHNDGIIRVSLITVDDYVPATPDSPGKIRFSFTRKFVRPSIGPKSEVIADYKITLSFMAYVRGINAHDILTFNPARIVITDYPGPLVQTPERTSQ